MIRRRSYIHRLSAVVAVCAAALCMFLALRPARQAVATVAMVQGDVQRDHGDEQAFERASVGDALAFGDALRTAPDATAKVVLADGSALDLEPSTVVRFLADAPEAARFRVDTGLAVFQAGRAGLSFATATGFIRVDPRSRVRFNQDGAQVRLEVTFGRASFMHGEKPAQSLGAGDELTLPNGQTEAVVRRAGEPAEQPVQKVLSTTEITADAEEETLDANVGQGMAARARADVTLRAGEQATVHHLSATTTVRMRVDDACDGRTATLEVMAGKGKYRPVGSDAEAIVFVARPGPTRYRVRCGRGQKLVAGSVRIVRDAAVRRVPVKPPTNTLDLDGRRYTVLYQNRLPSVVVRYPSKGSASPMRLVVQSGSRMRTYDEGSTSVRLSSGQLDDGEHRLFFESMDGKTRSAVTALRIAFDNAAPTASFDQRGELERDAAGHAQLSGVVPQGARVSLEGQALPVDASGRFRGTAQVTEGEQAIALRVDHPHAGVHYYVRRVAGEAGQE